MEEYRGFIQVEMTPEEMQSLPDVKDSDMLLNQYLIANQIGSDYEELYRWEGNHFRRVPYKQINNPFVGKVRARNTQQKLALDLLYDQNIKIKLVNGNYGSGKTFLMCAAATEMIEHGLFERIVYIRNNIEVKNSKPIGYLPGDYNDKLLPFVMPMADFLGGASVLERMMSSGKVEVVHLGFLRGRDLRNSIIMCSEAENMTREHMQLLIGRVGEGSELWIDGDNRQIDSEVFRTENGMQVLVDRLKGNRLFGCVKLIKTERSETAALADLLD